MHFLYCGIAVVFSLLINGVAFAYDVAVEFSATAVQIAPGKAEFQKKMYFTYKSYCSARC